MSHLHATIGLPCAHHERDASGNHAHNSRAVTVTDLGKAHPSRMRYEVKIEHPPLVVQSDGRTSKQAPEVLLFSDLEAARTAYRTYVTALGGDPVDCPEPLPAKGPTVADYQKLLARIEELEKRK